MLGADLTIKTIDDIIAGTLSPIPQDRLTGGTEPTPAPKIFKETCRIDWSATAVTIHNLVRGLSPYPAAWSTSMTEKPSSGAVKFFETKVTDTTDQALRPGQILISGTTLSVGTGDGKALEILSLQAPGNAHAGGRLPARLTPFGPVLPLSQSVENPFVGIIYAKIP